MIQTEKVEYQKAYVELYELIKMLPKEEKDKIPNIFLENLKNNMDKEYNFTFNSEKNILDQDYKIETKALFVELYERYLVPITEKELWNKYDKVCFNMIEEEKQKKYDSENIFNNRNVVKEQIKANKEENNLSKAYVEVLEILSHMEQKYVDMIPKKILDLFYEEKDKDYKANINPNISLTEQNLQRKTLVLLAMLNLNYWCKNETEKQAMLQMYADNDKKIAAEKRKKYDADNLFKKKEEIIEDNKNHQENVQLIEYKKQNIIVKIINKIMKFFKNNNYENINKKG